MDLPSFAARRSVDLERLSNMAQPKKRGGGGGADSWAVTAMAQKAKRGEDSCLV